MKRKYLWAVATHRRCCWICLRRRRGGADQGRRDVYVAGPLSGFQANTGQTVAGGVRLMAEQLNRSGGLLGYKVKVVALDDEADSDVAVSRRGQDQGGRGPGRPGGRRHRASELRPDRGGDGRLQGPGHRRHHADRVGGRPDAAGLPQLLPCQRRQRPAGEDRRGVPGQQAGRQEGRGALQRRLVRHRPGQAGGAAS